MSKDYARVLNEVLKEITPKSGEKKNLVSLAKGAVYIAKKESAKFKGKPMLAGSLTRDTWLPGKKEFDVFILFPPKLDVKKMEKFGLEIGKNVIKKMNGTFVIEYAQHPYVSGNVQGARIDIVPAFEIKSTKELKSAVDRTPFHVRYIEKRLSKKSAKEVRLLKQFCNANGLYGADAKTEGFSGYVCELLIVKYKKFMEVLENASEWEPGAVIDLENQHSKSEYGKLMKTFKGQPLILIDPTDETRNTGAAISSYNFFKFKKLAADFLKNPSKEHFFQPSIKPLNKDELISWQLKRRTEIIFVKFKTPDVVPDILWPQLRRFAERLKSILEEVKYEFKVFGKDVYSDKETCVILLEMEISKLPSIQKRIGPNVFDHKDARNFVEKYKKQALAGPYVENGFWVVEVSRKFMSARKKLEDSLKASENVLKAKGIPNFIASQLVKEVEIITETQKIIDLIKKDQEFGKFLRRYFEKESLV
ncbi:MAG: CCA tRNA nucleotidyltransferase [Candidatus Aenigmarchaeota archaeon]|nr:CCA tRNA nucleotidyltransferase [Candidatus Aenigmarchaeota archaeon]